ncbi:MAG: SGNH/GDSL hydrolase family protein [Planctomycetaceae bacterium]
MTSTLPPIAFRFFVICATAQVILAGVCPAQDDSRWNYAPELLEPFWLSEVVHAESVLFVKDRETGAAAASLLFPVDHIMAVRNAAQDITYEAGVDYRFDEGTRTITVPPGSRIITKFPEDLRREPGSQKYALTHRDGNGEILFGATLEYHNMQTWVTYRRTKDVWPVSMPSFDAAALPITIRRLGNKQPLSIVLLGDSISTGCNASGWGGGAPFQPAYQDLLRQHLEKQSGSTVTLTNLAVGGTSTPWGFTMIDQVVDAKPDLVLLAFGMNDSAGRSAEEYGQNVAGMIQEIRKSKPQTEFILIASMLGNRDWTRLNHDVFPKYRDALADLCVPGIALADMTSVWEEFLKRKQDHDLTGNGVNHPNDFGHRVYAQVLSALLVAPKPAVPAEK